MTVKTSGMLALSLLCATGVAQAGLFGPSNYDECVLDGVKDAKTETAARMVAQACRNKFPMKTSPPVTDYGPIRVTFYSDKTGQWENLVNKIKLVGIKDKTDMYGAKTEIRVMNDYTFGLSGIYIGVVAKGNNAKSCPSNYSDYKEVVGCGGQVGSKQAGTVTCERLTGAYYCVTGFTTEAGDYKQLIKKINDDVGVTLGK